VTWLVDFLCSLRADTTLFDRDLHLPLGVILIWEITLRGSLSG
jgi:hypothetical protein